ncbi:GNAT family N-acetyltransferase [Leucobacter sp. 1207-22]|uniref:GNAT family N-acetyltransferase n=1 Tax=Leucobacter sp. 1207-22 TaxID=2604456 RepID=UPI0040645451
MNEAPLIRRIAPEEYETVGRLLRDANEQDYDLPDGYLAQMQRTEERDTTSAVMVAIDQESGALLGTITLPFVGERLQSDTADDELDIRLLGVAHAARGKGVARHILNYCADIARERGLRRVVLHTGSHMPGAQRLYERLGYHRIPERDFEIFEQEEQRFVISYGLTV